MLGHSTIRTTELYAKLVNSRVQEEMSMLQKKLRPQKSKKSDK